MAAGLSKPPYRSTNATDTLTYTYLQKLGWQNYFASASVVFIVTFSFFWLLFRFGGEEKTIFFSDCMYALTSLVGAFFVCATILRARYGPLRLEPRHQLAWLLIGLALLSNGIAGVYYTYLEHIGQLNPVPSLSDIGFTIFYLLTFVGLLLLPTEPGTERFRLQSLWLEDSAVVEAKPRLQQSFNFRIRIALDALITTLCILGASWYFVIGPIFAREKDIPKLIVAVSYPFWDMLLILAIVLLIYQRTERILHPSLLLCGIGILAQVCGDTGYAIMIPSNTYITGTFYIDTFWFIGVLCIGLASLYQYATIVRNIYHERFNSNLETPGVEHTSAIRTGNGNPTRRFALVQSLLIYLPLAVMLTLTLYSEIVHEENLSFFLILLTVVVGLLVAIRYLLATHENEILLREREQRREEAEHLRILTARLTEVLEFDPLLTRIVHMVTYELGFDAALLVLNEDFDHPFGKQSNLLIRAISSISTETITLRLLGALLPFYADLSGKEVNVIWARQSQDVPTELSTWLQMQRIRSTFFLPLTYQGKVQGSLGFCSRAVEHLSHEGIPGDKSADYIVKAFTEQAAIAIEHAHLYRVAHEHELFSQALANIAARLNTAIAPELGVGADIHQLICTEGANALQADYALFYVVDSYGQLVPLAIYTSDSEPRSILSEWPPIGPNEYEAQALTSLQPILMQINSSISTSKELPALHLGTTTGPLSTTYSQPALSAVHPGYRGPRHPGDSLSTGKRSAFQSVAGNSLRQALLRRFVRTVILAPLITRDTAIGLLVLARSLRPGAQEKKSFAITDLAQAQDFSEQAAIAFTNAQLYAQLRNAHQRLQELDQLKDQFMITASHELRTPLTAVQGYLELLAEYDASLPPEQRKEFLQKARRGCEELVLLLSNVMDASRLEVEAGIRPAHIENVSVQHMIQSVIDLIEPHLTQEQREVHVHIPAHLFILADPARLRQVLLNIAVNALKYSPPGSPLMFSARSIFDYMPCAIISLTDKGKGIKPQDQARLFQRFVRLESDLNSGVRGSGLGLYISRRLIEAMGGKIWIESTGINGAGSTFHIQLPLAPDE